MNVVVRNPDDTYGNCKTCGAYCVHRVHHQCPPIWRVRMADLAGEEPTEVHGRDAEAAAERFCEEVDCDLDYSIIRNGEATLIVEREGVAVTVHIEAESRPHYSARIVREAPSPEAGEL